IANGKVYVPTFSDALVVYGLNPPPVSSITFMQVAAATPQSNSATVPVAYPQAEVAGDLNVVVVGWNDTTSSVSSVIDKLGNAYTLVVGPTPASGGQQSIYYAKNIKGGSNTVTVNFNQAAVYPDVRVLEYAGADTTSPIDAVLKGCVGSSTTASCGPITTNAANDLVFAADTIATGTPGPGAGFTARIITPHDSDLAEDEIAPNPGSYTATAPLSPSGYWVMQVVAFKVQGSTSSPAPTVSSVSPTSGSTIGGTAVTVAGTNFSAGATVTFGGTAASNVNVVSGTSITATTPAHAAGAVTAAVTNTDGQSGTLPNGFTYVSPTPTVSSISPNSGSTNGGTSVAITGTNFAAGATVTFGGTAATNVTIASSTQITAITPAHAAGAVNVVVTNTGGPSGTLANGFTYSSSTSKQITFVQVNNPNTVPPQGSVPSVSVSYPVAQTAGNLNIVVVGWNDTTSTVSSVVDSLGNTYSLAAAPAHASGATQSIYYAKNIKAGSNTVTVNFSQAAAYPDIRVLEYSGASTTSPVDLTAAAVGSSTTASCGPVTTTAANELIFAADTIATGTPGPGSGFTTRIITSHDSDLAEDKQAATAGSYSATAPVSPSGYWVIQMVTIKQ
ncbi:MAG TPA: IPT/TIG domain-containing protein, partial [Terriglobales bacterium]|nr:IPT/TIG domain-containing protein [Terriglobales bacterium]